jgi:hypothetical protein
MLTPCDSRPFDWERLTGLERNPSKQTDGVVAIRCEKTARNYLAVVTIAAIALWLRQPSTKPSFALRKHTQTR